MSPAISGLLAAAGAVMTYVGWYYYTVRSFCPAMWAGTAPPVIMLCAFYTYYRIMRRLGS